MRTLTSLLILVALVSQSAGQGFEFSKEAQKLREKLPKTDDPALKDLYKKHLIFYTEKEVPRAFQFEGSLFNAYLNIAPQHEPYGNANREFPWSGPGGTHRSKVTKFSFLHLPAPIVYWKGTAYAPAYPRFGTPDRPVTRWKYPDDAVAGEVVLNQQGKVFALRTRKKINGKWSGVNEYRSIVDREDYDATVTRFGADPGRPSVHLAQLKNSHNVTVFDETAAVDTLPALDKLIVDRLLEQPVKNVRGKPWLTYKGKESYAPTTEQDYHIVPKKYDGGFISVDSKSCARCHDSTMQDASYFQPARDWYGFVRGDDNILSFHIFDPKSVSNRGDWHQGYNVNPGLVKAGLLKQRQ